MMRKPCRKQTRTILCAFTCENSDTDMDFLEILNQIPATTIIDYLGVILGVLAGALFAIKRKLDVVGVVSLGLITGFGGGIIRDVLAGRKPLVLHAEIYAAWAILAGLAVGLKWTDSPVELYMLFIAVAALRILSYTYGWKLPRRAVGETAGEP